MKKNDYQVIRDTKLDCGYELINFHPQEEMTIKELDELIESKGLTKVLSHPAGFEIYRKV